MRGLAADRAKVITACATLARTSWHVDDEEMAEVMRQHCCVARDAVDRMQERIRKAEAENARLKEVGDELARLTNQVGLVTGQKQGYGSKAVRRWMQLRGRWA